MTNSYAWFEYFIGSEKGRRIAKILEDADEVYTPDTVWLQVECWKLMS